MATRVATKLSQSFFNYVCVRQSRTNKNSVDEDLISFGFVSLHNKLHKLVELDGHFPSFEFVDSDTTKKTNSRQTGLNTTNDRMSESFEPFFD